MTITRQLTLSLPDFDVDEQLDIFALLPTELDGVPVEWSTPARDLTTWQGMAEELAERLADFEALTLPAQGSVIGAALAHTYDNGRTLDDYLAGMIAVTGRNAAGRDEHLDMDDIRRHLGRTIARDTLAMAAAFGVEQ